VVWARDADRCSQTSYYQNEFALNPCLSTAVKGEYPGYLCCWL